jgi:hypothetical protein
MSRVTSATLYGSGTPTDLSRVNASRAPRSYGLRSGSSLDGYYPSYGSRPRRRVVREKVDPVTNLVGPADDDAPVVHYSRVDYGSERRSAGVIRMGEF